MDTEFEDVSAVARALGEDVALFGHSSGALCALGASLLMPALKHLVLYEPPLEHGPHYPLALRKLETLLREGNIDGVYDAWLKDYVGMPEDVAEAIKNSPVGMELRPFAQYLPREMAAHLTWNVDLQPFWKIAATTVYLTGSDTPATNAQLRGFIALLEAKIPKFSVREIPGQTHFANSLAPKLLAAIILDCIDIKIADR